MALGNDFRFLEQQGRDSRWTIHLPEDVMELTWRTLGQCEACLQLRVVLLLQQEIFHAHSRICEEFPGTTGFLDDTFRSASWLCFCLWFGFPHLVLVATATSCLWFGFLSLALSEIQVIRNFGLLSSILIAATSGLSILWFLATNNYFCFDKVLSLDRNFKYPRKTLPLKFILLVLLSSLVLGSFGLKNIPIETDATNYFSSEVGLKKNLDMRAPSIDLVSICY